MEWTQIIDQFPPFDAYVLICKYDKRKSPKTSFISIGSMSKEYKWFDHNNNQINEENGIISHWMPLPYMF